MATNTNITTTYAGEVAGDYLVRAFLAQTSLKYFTIRPNIPYEQVVRKFASDTTFADATCAFTPTGEVTITERSIILKKLQVQRELCKNDWIATWDALRAQNGDIGKESDTLVDVMLAGIAEANESMMWGGVAGTGAYNGLRTLIDADATVNFVASPAAITVDNVLDKLNLLIDEMPLRVKTQTEKPIIVVSHDVWEKYQRKQNSIGNFFYPSTLGNVPMMYQGWEIGVAPGLAANTMLFYQKSNVWFGTNKESDWNQIKVLDMEDNDLSENIRFSAKFYAAVQYGFGDEIAAYGPGLS